MSSTLPPPVLSAANPISEASVLGVLDKLGVSVKPDDLAIYTALLTGIWEVWNEVDQLGDYVPEVDEARFARQNVHRPEPKDNPSNAWAWRCTIEDAQPNSGLLAGRTVCLKDTIAVKGVPCLLGTDMISDWIPNTDATIVTRILEAGGTVNGKGVCENLCLWGLSNSAATGPMDNIHAAGYSAGGSSSGTAVCVGLGLSDMGVGGDQGGSIRLPACVNGLVGFKPTFGLIPYTGIASMEPMLDYAGPMTRTVLDNALLLQVMAGVDDIDDRQGAGTPFRNEVPDYPALAQRSIAGFRVGILTESLGQPLSDPRVDALVVTAAQALSKLGATVEMVSVPMHRLAPQLWSVPGRMAATSTFLGFNAARRGLAMNDLTDKMLPLTQSKADKMFPTGTNMLINGLWAFDNMSPSLLGRANNLGRKLRNQYLMALSKYDVLITPTLAFLPPKLPPLDAPIDVHMTANLGLSLNTSAFNLTGLPALSLPVGRLPSLLEDGALLPVGMQIIGKNFSEAAILQVAYAWEQAHDWTTFS